jgi:uncharacterized membrane protein YbhN (UPF0104 family)
MKESRLFFWTVGIFLFSCLTSYFLYSKLGVDIAPPAVAIGMLAVVTIVYAFCDE